MFDIRMALRDFMDERGIKQAYLARTCGVRSDCVSRILCGKRTLKAEELLDFCKALHVTPEELERFGRRQADG